MAAAEGTGAAGNCTTSCTDKGGGGAIVRRRGETRSRFPVRLATALGGAAVGDWKFSCVATGASDLTAGDSGGGARTAVLGMEACS